MGLLCESLSFPDRFLVRSFHCYVASFTMHVYPGTLVVRSFLFVARFVLSCLLAGSRLPGEGGRPGAADGL